MTRKTPPKTAKAAAIGLRKAKKRLAKKAPETPAASRNPFHVEKGGGKRAGFTNKVKPIPMPGKSRGRG